MSLCFFDDVLNGDVVVVFYSNTQYWLYSMHRLYIQPLIMVVNGMELCSRDCIVLDINCPVPEFFPYQKCLHSNWSKDFENLDFLLNI